MPKKTAGKKPSVKVKDLRAKKSPKGGAADIFAKLGDIKGESLDSKHKDALSRVSTSYKANLTDALSIKIK